ncbi:unnamed protein product [Notodromas monacha]|uniref:Uncharacterized protein n=1 Tax=Notodromas monacha TaxID=399045 RepID=A0A7R9BEW1_9CRUS|nr:unnamed protein product [Notodromas monacha]CAG0913543.1 unnamed protein product [Notodromas monacha]
MMDKPQILVQASEDVSYTIFDVDWYPGSAKLVSVGCQPRGTGVVQVFEITDGKMVECGSASLPNASKCCTFGASAMTDRKLIVGDMKGQISVVDLEKLQSVETVGAHDDAVNCIDGFGGLGAEGKGDLEAVVVKWWHLIWLV